VMTSPPHPSHKRLNEEKLRNLAALLLDVDGVLTCGQIVYDRHGEALKAFDVKDGLGLRMLDLAGIKVAIVTGRQSQALRHRCSDLKIRHVFEGVQDKLEVLPRLVAQLDVTPHRMGFIGDDLTDLPLLRAVGASIAVADAHELVRREADMVTVAPGGRGAAREVCEALLKAQGRWDEMLGCLGV